MGEMLAALVPFLLIFRTTICIVTGPSSLRLEYKVGESAKLMWNSTKRITQVRFGLYDYSGNDISTQFVVVNVIAGVQYTNLSNTAAERYARRVQWVGNLTLGRAWFTVINLQQKDFEVVYAAKIRESGDTAEPSFPVNLTLSRGQMSPQTEDTGRLKMYHLTTFDQ